MKKILNKKLICIPTCLLSISSKVRTAKIHLPICAALHMPHPSPKTPVSLSILQSMALKQATQIEERWKMQQICSSLFLQRTDGSFYFILRSRQRREHSLYLCNSLICAPRKKISFNAMLSLGSSNIFLPPCGRVYKRTKFRIFMRISLLQMPTSHFLYNLKKLNDRDGPVPCELWRSTWQALVLKLSAFPNITTVTLCKNRYRGASYR